MTDIVLTPFFPLNLVAFPGEVLKLHIFEPRYKQLIGECESGGIMFVIPPYTSQGLHMYGTEMALKEVFDRYPGGELDISVTGESAVRIKSFARQMPGKLYPGGEIHRVENVEEPSAVTAGELAKQYARFHALLGTPQPAVRTNFDIPGLSFAIAHELGLTLEQKVRLLGIPGETDRRFMLIQHLHNVIPSVEAAEETRRRLKGNGHFFKPPQMDL